MNPNKLRHHDVVQRAGMCLSASSTPTYRTENAHSQLDYFVYSKCLEHVLSEPHAHVKYPLSPHRPVSINIQADA
eukprot:2021690-Pyramimonas_sp.AAC.1